MQTRKTKGKKVSVSSPLSGTYTLVADVRAFWTSSQLTIYNTFNAIRAFLEHPKPPRTITIFEWSECCCALSMRESLKESVMVVVLCIGIKFFPFYRLPLRNKGIATNKRLEPPMTGWMINWNYRQYTVQNAPHILLNGQTCVSKSMVPPLNESNTNWGRLRIRW